MNGKTLARFTKYLLDFMFFSGIAATAGLPWLFRFVSRYYPNIYNYYAFNVALFMLSGAGTVLIIFDLRRMFKTVLADDCFVRANVRSLRRMGFHALGVAAVTAARILLVFTPSALIIVLVFFIGSLFSFVLAGVFDKAVSYKLENDLTI